MSELFTCKNCRAVTNDVYVVAETRSRRYVLCSECYQKHLLREIRETATAQAIEHSYTEVRR